ncbi:hypothetical protein OS493_039443, partial [Desmophyllum pertusum]
RVRYNDAWKRQKESPGVEVEVGLILQVENAEVGLLHRALRDVNIEIVHLRLWTVHEQNQQWRKKKIPDREDDKGKKKKEKEMLKALEDT